MVGSMGRSETALALKWDPCPGTAPGISYPTSSTATPSATFTTQVLRLAPAHEPPAEEADEAAHDDDHSHRDTCDGPAA